MAPKPQWALRAVLIVVLLAVLAAYAWLRVSPPSQTTPIQTSEIKPETGVGYYVPLIVKPAAGYNTEPDSNEHPTASSLKLLENGHPLGPAHATHAEIFASGSGRYSHWGDILIFSASDNSDPRTNNRQYAARLAIMLPAWVDTLAIVLGVAALIAGGLLEATAWIVKGAGRRALTTLAWIGSAARRIERPTIRSGRLRVVALGAVIVALMGYGWLVVSPPVEKTVVEVDRAVPLQGFAFQAPLRLHGDFGYSTTPDSNNGPAASTLDLLENDKPLIAHSQHSDIQVKGRGRFSHWGATVIFASSDNTDPRSNGKVYATRQAFAFPGWVHAIALALLVAAIWLARAYRWPPAIYRAGVRVGSVIDRPGKLAAVALIMALGLGLLYVLRPAVSETLEPAGIVPMEGKAYSAYAPQSPSFIFPVLADTNPAPEQSRLRLTESGAALGPPHYFHGGIIADGGGRYSHWENVIVFSSSDGSDPRTNGRAYVVSGPVHLAWFVWLPWLAVIAGLIARALWTYRDLDKTALAVWRRRDSICLGAALITGALAAYGIASAFRFYPIFANDSSSYFGSPMLRGYFLKMIFEAGMNLGLDPRWIVLFQFGMFGAGALTLGRAVGRVSGSPAAGWLVSAALFADVQLLQLLPGVMSEPLFYALVMLHVAFGLHAIRGGRIRDFALAAAFAGFAILVRPAGYGFVLGLGALAQLIRPWSWKRVVVGAGAFAVVFTAGSLPTLINNGAFAPQGSGGIAMIGHVVQLADKSEHYSNPEMAEAVIDSVSGISTATKATWPEGYWATTSNEYNILLWQTLLPRASQVIYRQISSSSSSKKSTDEVNAVIEADLRRMSTTIILDHPFGYIRHVLAHVYGMWAGTMVSPGLLAAPLQPEWDNSPLLVTVNPVLQKFVGSAIYPPADVAARWATASKQVSAIDQIWITVRPYLQMIVFPVAIASFVLCFWAAGMVALRRPLSRPLAGAAFVSVQLWAYNLVVAMAQPGLGRYSSISGILFIAAAMLLVAAAAPRAALLVTAATRNLRGMLSAARPRAAVIVQLLLVAIIVDQLVAATNGRTTFGRLVGVKSYADAGDRYSRFNPPDRFKVLHDCSQRFPLTRPAWIAPTDRILALDPLFEQQYALLRPQFAYYRELYSEAFALQQQGDAFLANWRGFNELVDGGIGAAAAGYIKSAGVTMIVLNTTWPPQEKLLAALEASDRVKVQRLDVSEDYLGCSGVSDLKLRPPVVLRVQSVS